jgi:CRISPR type III-B/RAMP module-associated protein Cmr3
MKTMHTLDFIPADTLFCRDGRPLAAGSSFGRGAFWPLPTVLHSAVRSALLRSVGEIRPRKQQPGTRRRGQPTGNVGSLAFQWLHLHGPFPVEEDCGRMWFPAPRDLLPDKSNSDQPSYLQVIQARAGSEHDPVSNLPGPFTHLVASFLPPCKETLPEWVEAAFLQQYLTGMPPLPKVGKLSLWDTDHHIGVALEDASHTAATGQLFAAEHLRLRRGVKLRFRVSLPPSHKGVDGESQAINQLHQALLQLGGEQRFGLLMDASPELRLPQVEIQGVHVKWLLLTPAIFAHGWRPGWVDEQGNVKLRVVDKEARRDFRRQRRDRADWRYDGAEDKAESIDARLVAACLGKPQQIGGWELLHERDGEVTGGGKPTHLAVPSGSVFYFQAGSEPDAERLVRVLQGRCRSDFFGEKGLGLGVCGNWQHQLRTSPDVRSADNSQTTN